MRRSVGDEAGTVSSTSVRTQFLFDNRNRAPIPLARPRIPGNPQWPARAFLQRKSSVLVRLILFCLGLLKTPPKVVSTAFTIDSSGSRTI